MRGVAAPDTDYYGWLVETSERIAQGRWEEIDLAAAAEEFQSAARRQVRQFNRHLQAWLEAGGRRDGEAARLHLANLAALLQRSPSLRQWDWLKARVHETWPTVEKRLREAGHTPPRPSYADLDTAAGKVYRHGEQPGEWT